MIRTGHGKAGFLPLLAIAAFCLLGTRAWSVDESWTAAVFELPSEDITTITPEEVIKEYSPIVAGKGTGSKASLADAYRFRGVAYSQLEMWDAARKDFEELCKLCPNDMPAKWRLASALAALGLYDEALREIERVLATSPAFARAYVTRAGISLVLLCHLWHPAGVRAHLTGMKTTTRIPQAPLEPLPALAEFLAPFRLHFARSEGPQALDRYLSGLLTEQPIKNCDTIAQVVPGTSAQQLQGLLTAMDWDHDDLNRQRVQRLQQMATEGDGVLIFDDTGFAKQGRCSVGVARQYSGTLGKVGNCQVTVNCHYAERTLGWPVATRLYLPQDWAENAGRRAKAGVPEEVAFRTKPEIALDLLDQAEAWGVRWACVVADADYGDNPNFLAGLEKRRQRYVVAVRCDFAVALSRRAGPVQRADPVIAAQPASAWRTVRWREGSKGWLRGRFVALRCWRVLANGRRRVGWLIGEQPGGDPAADRKYYWSNLRSQAGLATLVGYAHRRHWVEQYHEEAKGLLGWDQYQGRLWTGFHRHAVCVMLAYSFLVWQEWQQRPQRARRGRPRRAFSPSEGPAAGAAAGDPPAGVRLATPPRGQGVAAA